MLRKTNKSLSFKDKAMTDTAQARDLFSQAFPAKRYGKIEAAIYEAYRFLKPLVEPRIDREFTLRRVRSLHEGKAKRIDGAELEALQLAKIEEVRREYNDCKARLEKLEKAVADLDATAPLAALAAYRSAADGMGRMDLSRD